mgnify:FL=1
MSGSRSTQTTNASNAPNAGVQAGYGDVINTARNYMADASQHTPTFSQDTRDAASMLGQLGRQQGSQQQLLPGMIDQTQAGFGTANNVMQNTANGGMMTSNPYLDANIATTGRNTMDAINRQFAGAGRYGSGANQGVVAQKLGELEGNARMQNYSTERQNQMNAAQYLGNQGMQGANLAGQMDTANRNQLGLLAAGGTAQDQMNNAERTAGMGAAQQAMGLLSPIGAQWNTQNSTQTTQTPTNWGAIAGGLGSAALGAMSGGATGGMSSLFGNFFGGGSR